MIKFAKMEGLGNDYVYVDCTQKLNEVILAALIAVLGIILIKI